MERRRISVLRSIVVFVLMAAAVIQTGMLWLNGNQSHNIFYYVSGIFKNAADSSGSPVTVSPGKVAVGNAGSTFAIIYGGDNDAAKYSESIISELAKKEAKSVDFDWTKVLKYRCAVLAFDFPVPTGEYMPGFFSENENEMPELKSFKNIVVVPSGESQDAEVYFVSPQGSKAVLLKGQSQYADKLVSEVEKVSENAPDSIKYISTAQSGLNIFSSNIFVAQWTQNQLQYGTVTKTPAFSCQNENDFRTETGQYFKNYPAVRVSVDSNNTYTGSDNTTVLKYYSDGVLEYFNYDDSSNSKAAQTLSSAYSACDSFLKSDSSIKTGYYLSDVNITGDGLTFLFDYYINNLPVILSEGLSVRTDMTHAMEVVVKDNTVKKFKRYAYNYSVGTDNSYADRDFLSAMNDAMAGGISANLINDIVFGYSDENSEYAKCIWLVKTDDSVYRAKTAE